MKGKTTGFFMVFLQKSRRFPFIPFLLCRWMFFSEVSCRIYVFAAHMNPRIVIATTAGYFSSSSWLWPSAE